MDAGSSHAWQLLVRFFFAQRERLSTGSGHNLSPAQWHVLHLIQPDQPVSMGRLAETLGCDASNVTGLVDRLEVRGLVERRPAAGDRRVKALHLTPAGSRLRAQMLRQIAGGSCRLARLSPQDQRTLVRILETLIDD
jgi:DNA-binding MarR family transcriptional regulator